MQNEIQITSSPAVKSRLVEETHKRTAPNIKLVNFWTCWLLLLLLGICQVVQLQFRDFVQQGEGASLEAKLLFWVWIIPKEASMSRELGTYLSIVRRLHHDSMVSLVTPLFFSMVTPDNAHIGNIEKIMLRDVWNLKHRCSTRDEETLFVSSLRWLPQNDQTAALVEVPPLFSDWTDPSMGICPVMSVNRICICIHVIERVPSMGICSPWQLVRRRDGPACPEAIVTMYNVLED